MIVGTAKGQVAISLEGFWNVPALTLILDKVSTKVRGGSGVGKGGFTHYFQESSCRPHNQSFVFSSTLSGYGPSKT